jgi:NTE family protein
MGQMVRTFLETWTKRFVSRFSCLTTVQILRPNRLYRRFLSTSLVCAIGLLCIPLGAPARQSNELPGRGPLILRPEYVETNDRIPNILPIRVVKRPKVALVFSGGGVRGISGVGVLKSFERNGIPVDYIVGTSIGAIVGGLYACGYSTRDLENLVATTDWKDVLSYSDESERRDLFLDQKLAKDRSSLIFRFQGLEPVIPSSYSTAQRLTNYLNILTLQGIFHPNPSFDDLKIPFRVVTTDLVSGKRVVIDRGDLAEALRAAVSVPLLFSPVIRDTMQLMDGGLVSNIPVDVAREIGADIVIAVDATSPLRPVEQLKAPWEVADQIITIMMQLANRQQLQHADIVVRPELGNHLASDFSGLDSLIHAGEAAGDAAAPTILKLLMERREALLRASNHTRVFHSPRVEFDPAAVAEDFAHALRSWNLKEEISEREVLLLLARLHDTGEYADVSAEAAWDETRTQLRIRPQRNPVLTGVTFVGNNEIPSDTLLQPFLPLIGRRVNTNNTRAAIEELLGMYRDHGYSLARIRQASFDPASGRAVIVIDEGMVERREIKGTKKTKDYVLWREMPLKGREVFTVAKAAQSIRNLYSTNLFEQVLITVRDDHVAENIHHIVEVRVRERPTELIRLSLRVDNERSVQPSVDIRDENFLGIGSELGVSAFGGLRNRYYSGGFKAMRIFNSYLTFDLKGFYSVRDAYAFHNEPIADPTRWNRVRNG